MIVPGAIFKNRKWNELSPALVLVGLNIAVFIFLLFAYQAPEVSSVHRKEELARIKKIAAVYYQTLDPLEKKQFNPDNTQEMFRDGRFWYRIENFPFYGDQVQIQQLRDFVRQIKQEYFESPQYVFGLSPRATTPWAWITYQFLHTGFLHLFMNVLFLLLITEQLQRHVEDFWCYTVYILGGISGGVFYLLYNQRSEIAVVGASGAICGLIAFLSVVKHSENIEWTYFMAPAKNYFGTLAMPAFLLFPIYLISDITSVLYYKAGVQMSVAHSAHVGGTLAGVVLGGIYLFDRSLKNKIMTVWGQDLSLREYQKLRDGHDAVEDSESHE